MAKFPKTPEPEPEPTVDDLLEKVHAVVGLSRQLIGQIHAAYPAIQLPRGMAPEVRASELFAPLRLKQFTEAAAILNDPGRAGRGALHLYIFLLEELDFPVWRWLTRENDAHGGEIWRVTELGRMADGKPVKTTAKARFDATKANKVKKPKKPKEQCDERDD